MESVERRQMRKERNLHLRGKEAVVGGAVGGNLAQDAVHIALEVESAVY